MTWKKICLIVFIAIVLGAIYYPYRYQMRKSRQNDIVFHATFTAKNRYYREIVENKNSGQVSRVSPDDLIAYFRNIPELPPFLKLDDIMLPLDSVKIPSDEILFAIRINAKEACAVTGAGEIKTITLEKMPKCQNP